MEEGYLPEQQHEKLKAHMPVSGGGVSGLNAGGTPLSSSKQVEPSNGMTQAHASEMQVKKNAPSNDVQTSMTNSCKPIS
eukprot:scaffold65679_cov21-Tisochrysis_lutea.AAC.2